MSRDPASLSIRLMTRSWMVSQFFDRSDPALGYLGFITFEVNNLDIRECDGNSLHLNGAWNTDITEGTFKGAKRAVIRFGND